MASTAYQDESNGAMLVGTAAFFLALTYLSVGLRTYVRVALTKSFQTDDWLMLAAQAIFTLSCAFVLAGTRDGLGRHNTALPQRQEIRALMWQALAVATYVANMLFIKLSIAVFLLRLSARKRRYTYTLWASMAVVAVWCTVAFFWDVFQCSPVQAQWDYTVAGLRCAASEDVVGAAYSLSALSIATDWLYALLPIPMVWNAHMTPQAKTTVVVILGLGLFASVATLIRLKFLADINDTADLLFATTNAMVWTLVEPGVAIVAASLVTIRPLLRRMSVPGFETIKNTLSGSRRRQSVGDGELAPGPMILAAEFGLPPAAGTPFDRGPPSPVYLGTTTLQRESDVYVIEGPRRPAAWHDSDDSDGPSPTGSLRPSHRESRRGSRWVSP